MALVEAIQRGYVRGIMFCKVSLAAIFLDQGEITRAKAELAESSALAHLYHIRGAISDALRVQARLYFLRGDLAAAQDALTKAIELYERLGRRRELAEARDELGRLAESKVLRNLIHPSSTSTRMAMRISYRLRRMPPQSANAPP